MIVPEREPLPVIFGLSSDVSSQTHNNEAPSRPKITLAALA